MMKLNILGMMSGTSCDGIDVACLEFAGERWRPLWSQSLPYPSSLRKRVLAIQARPHGSLLEFLQLHRDLGHWYAQSVQKCLRGVKKSQQPDVIANHGQTVAHFPDEYCTSQLGDPSLIAKVTGLTTISEFRRGDLAALGQGAPLVPLFHRALLQPGQSIHNLGGISNFTYLTPEQEIIGFDTGPGNLLIDAAAEKISLGKLKFDRSGKLASRGKIHHPSLERMLKHPYFRKAPPKSTGRDDFPIKFLFDHCKLKDESLVATATALTAVTIAIAYENSVIHKRMPLTEIFFCGGGAKNPTLLEMIQELMPETQVQTIEAKGLNSQYIEAQAFAYFGYLSLLGENLGGSWTGQKPGTWAPPGTITPGKNWGALIKKISAMV